MAVICNDVALKTVCTFQLSAVIVEGGLYISVCYGLGKCAPIMFHSLSLNLIVWFIQ